MTWSADIFMEACNNEIGDNFSRQSILIPLSPAVFSLSSNNTFLTSDFLLAHKTRTIIVCITPVKLHEESREKQIYALSKKYMLSLCFTYVRFIFYNFHLKNYALSKKYMLLLCFTYIFYNFHLSSVCSSSLHSWWEYHVPRVLRWPCQYLL